MGARALQHSTNETRIPPGRERKPRAGSSSADSEAWSVPKYYTTGGRWNPIPGAITELYGGKLDGCAFATLLHMSSLQIERDRKGHDPSSLPAAEWSSIWSDSTPEAVKFRTAVADEKRIPSLAKPVAKEARPVSTGPVSANEIATSVKYSRRMVEYTLADFYSRGITARRKAGSKFEYSLLFDFFNRVPMPEEEAIRPPEPAAEEEDETAEAAADEQPQTVFVHYGSEPTSLPKPIRRFVMEDSQNSLQLTIIGGEARVRVLPAQAGQTGAKEKGTTTAMHCGGPASNPLIPNNGVFAGLDSSEPEAKVAAAAISDLQKRSSGKPLQVDTRVTGDYITLTITPRGAAYSFGDWDQTIQKLALTIWEQSVASSTVHSIARKCTALKRSPADFSAYAMTKASRKINRAQNVNLFKAPDQSPGLLDHWANDAVDDWAKLDTAGIAGHPEPVLTSAPRRRLSRAEQALGDDWIAEQVAKGGGQ